MSSEGNRSSGTRKYLAFISYSSRDQKYAQWLIKALETYRVPSKLVGPRSDGPSIPRRLVPIFRDRDELRTEPDLDAALGAALSQSSKLIVLCSPNSARPESWVNREIIKFKASGRKADILALIVSGVPHASERGDDEAQECFPKPLRYDVGTEGRITDKRVEPVAADLLREDRRPRVSRRKALLKLVSGIIDVDFDELWQRDRQRRRRRLLAGGAAALVAVIGLFTLVRTAINATRTELSARLAQQASVAARDMPDTALLLSVAAFNTSPTAAAYGSLLTAVNATEHMATSFHDLSEITSLTLSNDGRKLAAAGCKTAGCVDPQILVYDLETRRFSHDPIAINSEQVSSLTFEPGTGHLLSVLSSDAEHRLVSFDLTQALPEPEPLYRGNQTITGVAESANGAFYVVALGDSQHMSEFKLFAEGAGRRCGDILNSPILAMQFSMDARLLALAAGDGEINVVNVADCSTKRFHYFPSQDVAFDAPGQSLIAIMADGTMTEWNLLENDPHGHPVQILTGPVNGYLHELSPDAAYLASLDGTDILLTNVAKRRDLIKLIQETDEIVYKENLRFQLNLVRPVRLRGHTDEPHLLQFSADNRILVTADAHGKAIVWDVKGAPLVERAGYNERAEINALTEPGTDWGKEAISPDGRIVASVSESSVGCSDAILAPGCQLTTRLRLRNRETNEVVGSLDSVTQNAVPKEKLENAFTPEGDVVTMASDIDEPFTRYYTWHIGPQKLVERACRRANRSLGPADPEIQTLVQGWRTWLVGVACEER